MQKEAGLVDAPSWNKQEQRLGSLLDLVGILILSGLVVWTCVAAWLSNGNPSPSVALCASLAAGFVLGRAFTRISAILVPAAVVATTGILWLVAPADFFSDQPASYPFGYVNAKGAFLVQACSAALLLAAVSRSGARRNMAVCIAVGLAFVPFAFDSIAAGLLSTVVVIGAWLGGHAIRRSLVPALGALVGAVLVLTLLLASFYPIKRSTLIGEIAASMRSEQRVALWHNAASLFAHHPLRGVGPGRFELASPIARAEQDVKWAPNIFLEQGAESGVPGFTLMILLWAWGFVRLGFNASPSHALIGGAAWAALGIHACFDYVLHYSAVPFAAAALLGAATMVRSKNGVTREEDPRSD